MEEKNKKNTLKLETPAKEKLTYEQLNDACNQLAIQNRQLIKKCQELDNYSMFKRLDYLFMVLKYKDSFDTDFVITCADEIKEAIIIPKEEKEEKDDKVEKEGQV